jgi:predicted nucleic acid-binding protein
MAKVSTKVPGYYFDACLFLVLINDDAPRSKMVEALLDDAEAGNCEIYTSQLSVAEVAFGDQEKKGKALSALAEKKIDKLWHPTSPIRLIDVHNGVSSEARSVIRQAMKQGWTKGENWSVKPPDAIHVASAKLLKVQHLFTYDDRLIKLDRHAGISIREPFLLQGRLGVNP